MTRLRKDYDRVATWFDIAANYQPPPAHHIDQARLAVADTAHRHDWDTQQLATTLTILGLHPHQQDPLQPATP